MFTNFWGYVPPVSYAYVDRQYKRHYAAQKKGSQDKQKLTSGPQTVKTHIKSFFAFSFFAFYTCFRTSISQIQFRILYVVRFRTFAFSHFAFYTCPWLNCSFFTLYVHNGTAIHIPTGTLSGYFFLIFSPSDRLFSKLFSSLYCQRISMPISEKFSQQNLFLQITQIFIYKTQ